MKCLICDEECCYNVYGEKCNNIAKHSGYAIDYYIGDVIPHKEDNISSIRWVDQRDPKFTFTVAIIQKVHYYVNYYFTSNNDVHAYSAKSLREACAKTLSYYRLQAFK